MNYLKTYYLLIESRKKNLRDAYQEIHHIVPRSVYGSGLLNELEITHINDPNNLVFLTPREHFIAHWLLARAFPNNKQLVGAFWAMSNFAKPESKTRNYIISSRVFQEARILYSQSKFKRVIQYSLNGEFIKVFESHLEASVELNIHMSGISGGAKKSAGGYLWRDFTENFPIIIDKYNADSAAKSVVQLSPDGIYYINTYPSAVVAAKKNGISYGHISSCCCGKRNSSGGYKWIFEEDYDYNLPTSTESSSYFRKIAAQIARDKSSKSKFIPVAQYSKEGDFIQLFDSLKSASLSTRTDRISLGQCCRGEIKSANNFIWRYANESPEVKILPFERKKRYDSYEVGQYDLEGKLVHIYSNLAEVSIIADTSAVYDVIIGRSKSAGGFQWQKYAGVEKIKPLIYQTNRGKKILQIDIKSGQIIGEFCSLTDASKETGFLKSSIGKAAKGERKTANGFIWKFI